VDGIYRRAWDAGAGRIVVFRTFLGLTGCGGMAAGSSFGVEGFSLTSVIVSGLASEF